MANIHKAERIEKLVSDLRKANKAYYLGDPIMTDEVYDAKFNLLKKLAPKHIYLKKIGERPKDKELVVSRTDAMGSLNKATNFTELRKWMSKYPLISRSYLVLPKYDGLSGELVYKGYSFHGAYTRGDGVTGEDITEAIKKCEDIPEFIEMEGMFVIRGEFYITKEDFRRLNEIAVQTGREPFKNPRNVAVGLINARQCCYPWAPSIKLRYIAWQLQRSPKGNFESESQDLEFIRENLKIPIAKRMYCNSADDDADLFERWTNVRRESHSPLDGMVISLNSHKLLSKAGKQSNGTPNGKIAYKFPPAQASTVVTKIEVNVGRTGKITPTIWFKPVILEGSTVQKSTGDNCMSILDKKYDVGSKVIVQKGGDIIPNIVGRCEGEKPKIYAGPDKCPTCGSKLEEFGRNMFCRNPLCPSQLQQRMLHFCKTLEIMGVGETLACKLSDKMTSLSDIFDFTVQQFTAVTGSRKVALKIHEEVEKASQRQTLSLLLESLGIPSLGREKSRELAKCFKKLEDLLNVTSADILYNFWMLPGGMSNTTINCKIANEFFVYFKEFQKLVKKFGVVTVDKEKHGIFKGKSFMFTGTLSKPRKEFESLIECNAGTITGLCKSLNYLILGDGGKEAKANKAREYGAKVLTEKELLAMLEG